MEITPDTRKPLRRKYSLAKEVTAKWVRWEDIPATRTVYAVARDGRRVGQERRVPRAACSVTCGP